MNDDFISISQYLETKTSIKDRIIAIDGLIDSMILRAADAVDTANYSEYQMDDGQMKVRTMYRSPEDIMKGVSSLEKIKQMYVNRVNGRVTVFRGGQL